MHPGTEELLSIRDGKPVDVEARAAVDADPALRAEVARLQATRDQLRDLPAFRPPPGVRAKVFAELETDAGTTDNRPRTRRLRNAQWPLRGAIAATVAVVALLGLRSLDQRGESAPGTVVAENPASVADPRGLGGAAATYTSLTSESARLERLLNQIPYRPRVMNAATATTISGLEDRIGQVDEILMYASLNGLQQEQAMTLWQERVDLMNALLEVRYAQAQRFGF